jgi:hypothetical protein
LTSPDHRCLGLEQELFLVDEGGILSNSADEVLAGLREEARSAGKDPACFAPAVSLGMIEVIVPPARSLPELSCEYLECLELAIEAVRGMGLRLYPLATYPLPMKPACAMSLATGCRHIRWGRTDTCKPGAAPGCTCTWASTPRWWILGCGSPTMPRRRHVRNYSTFTNSRRRWTRRSWRWAGRLPFARGF